MMLFESPVLYALIVACLLAISTLAYLLLRHKNRLIWAELFSLREQYGAVAREALDLRKEIVLASEARDTRLPALMPSQNGEDVLLWKFFGRKHTGFYIDVGAYDGVGFSNTYFFEALGWTGIDD